MKKKKEVKDKQRRVKLWCSYLIFYCWVWQHKKTIFIYLLLFFCSYVCQSKKRNCDVVERRRRQEVRWSPPHSVSLPFTSYMIWLWPEFFRLILLFYLGICDVQAESGESNKNKLKLYSYWRSSCSQRVRIALNLKGFPFSFASLKVWIFLLVFLGGISFSSLDF